MSIKTFVVVAGYWSTNIGNSFFQLGAEFMLRQAFPNDRVVLLSDQPGYWDVNIGNPPNSLDYLAHIDMDYLVIQGPYLRPEYPKIWEQTLRKLKERGIKIIVLSAGMMDYSQKMQEQAREWLTEIPPYVFITRDTETYKFFGDLATHAMDGVDVATFVSDLHHPLSTTLPPYIIFNFDQIPEPTVAIDNGTTVKKNEEVIQLNNLALKFRFASRELNLARRYKFYLFLRSLLPMRPSLQESIADHIIVRTDHRFNPMLLQKSYAAPNSFTSDIPHTYLNLYANTEATFSNRVHACVATLAYGKPAKLFSNSPRAYLLDRLGAVNIRKELIKIDTAWLKQEKSAMIDFLRQVVN
ncbi:MAG: polysaccharide pyruvyl transferase family protein [Dolichospermum sp. DET50]|nr:polysaccharide pyruvyl transferase family protein [Dolichospermum sp. DET66]MBS3032566.1 polysaccharide pyruvyl transferase family protein [Dolichospermum sp. DET67]MBS3037772.1 polysaccharide pyruvyl transferase family protein [Dolichospermum sp. DET50]QSX69712.1 MAG: polysaccharide pyruvyl transferase family protein [Dolichospermum sp. DET69]